MNITKIPFQEVTQFSKKDKAYVNPPAALRPFYKYETSIESFAQVIQDKKNDQTNRHILVEVLEEQYQKFDPTPVVKENIEKLKATTTFTVTTAHQPSLCTGPLYYIYKIVSAINLAKSLKKAYSSFDFVPIFVTGGEDHDFEEVNHFHLFGKTLTWENDEKGSVGMMGTASLNEVLNELKSLLGASENAQKIYQIIHEAYTANSKYSDATIHLTNKLFEDDGLVVLNMNHNKLKNAFSTIIAEEILKRPSQAFVEIAAQELEEIGFSGQAHPREINFFYLRNQIRERIVFENDRYKVLNTDISFSEAEIEAEIGSFPERFSPNVVMRPLFQELILPNLAYIGGGGEIAYWLERKKQFEHFGINFPMLIRRNSVLWIDRGSAKKMDKLSLTIHDLLQDTEDLIKRFVKINTENELSLHNEKTAIQQGFDKIKEKATEIDQSLATAVLAEAAKTLKSLGQLEGRLMKAEKQKHEVSINQIRSLKEKFFPGNGLQERYNNFIEFYLKYGDDFIGTLKKHLDPMQKELIVLIDG